MLESTSIFSILPIRNGRSILCLELCGYTNISHELHSLGQTLMICARATTSASCVLILLSQFALDNQGVHEASHLQVSSILKLYNPFRNRLHLPEDSIWPNISPNNSVLCHVRVHSNHISQISYQLRIVLPFYSKLSDVPTISEKKAWFSSCKDRQL